MNYFINYFKNLLPPIICAIGITLLILFGIFDIGLSVINGNLVLNFYGYFSIIGCILLLAFYIYFAQKFIKSDV